MDQLDTPLYRLLDAENVSRNQYQSISSSIIIKSVVMCVACSN